MRTKIREEKGLSTLEVMCISFIAVVAVALIIIGILWYRKQMLMGDDQMLLNNAESTATLNSTGNGCMVRECDGGNCEHLTSEGYVGYFDHPTNTIYGKKHAGYNEYKEMVIGEKTFHGAPGTMIIKIVNKDGEYTFSWVKGDYNNVTY